MGEAREVRDRGSGSMPRVVLFAWVSLLAAPACGRGATSTTPPPSEDAGAGERPLAEVDAHVDALRRDFAARTGPPRPDDVEWVRRRLAHLVALDQYLRGIDDPALAVALVERMQALDRANTDELRSLVDRHGWIRVSIFGAEADRDAWLLVQHADHDPGFQARILAILRELYPQGETSPVNYAYLHDRVAIAEQRPQRYGTQGDCLDGGWTPQPIEEPAAVDSRRAEVGLQPLAEYAAQVSELCRSVASP